MPGQQPPKKRPDFEVDGNSAAVAEAAVSGSAAAAATAKGRAEVAGGPERPSTPPLFSDMRSVASFTQLKDATPEDTELLASRYNEEIGKNLVNRVLGMLKDQDRPELMLGSKAGAYTRPLFSST